MEKVILFSAYKNVCYRSLVLYICFAYFNNLLCTIYNPLAELNSTLTSLGNIYQTRSEVKPQEPEYLSDPNFFNMLLEKTKNAKLQNKLRIDIEKLRLLSPENQKLARYLLHLLFENESFARLYRNGGADPNFNYKIGEYYVYADGSTDLVTRILLVINIVNDIQNNWPMNDEIGIVSLAGGELLQDYILIKALSFTGYNKINLSVIDFTDHTKDLKKIIKNDETLGHLTIKINYYHDTEIFLSNAGTDEMSINVCYLVSATHTGPRLIPQTSKISTLLARDKINLLRIGEQDNPSIIFYIPYNNKNSFINCFYFKLIIDINTLLSENDNLADAFDGLQQIYPDSTYAGDDIMVDFYDIIKNSKLKPCFGYIALSDKITEYKNVQDTPYYKLNYDHSMGIIWAYNPTKKRFVPVGN